MWKQLKFAQFSKFKVLQPIRLEKLTKLGRSYDLVDEFESEFQKSTQLLRHYGLIERN